MASKHAGPATTTRRLPRRQSRRGEGILWTNNCPRAPTFQRWDAMDATAWETAYAAAEDILAVQPDPAAASRAGHAIAGRLRGPLAADGRAILGLPLSGRLASPDTIHYNAPRDILDAASEAARQRITMQSGARATRMRHWDGRVTGVDMESGDGTIAMEAPTVLVAGGAIGTAQLLYRSGIRLEALGRGFSFHALLFGQVVLAPDLCPPAGEPDVAPRLWIPPTEAASWHIQVLRDTCPLKPTEAVDNPHRLLEFQAFLPVEPNDENALIIDGEERPEFRFAFSESDRERMGATEADVRRLAAALGPWRRGCEPSWVPHGNAHIVGTCRMDRRGWPGVADRLGRVHGFHNLYLATAGLFPVAVAVNPTLTALALALNTCEAIAGA